MKIKKGNILVWALSLVIAVVLWGYVIFYINPEGVHDVTGIPVEFINEQRLASRELILTRGREETITVRFTGRMQSFAGINRNTVTAVIDLGNTNTTGDNILMQYELRGPPEMETLNVDRSDPPVVPVAIDRVRSKYVPLRLTLNGEAAEGFGFDPALFDPARIHVTGPAKELDTIYEAVARYEPLDPISRTVAEMLIDYTLYTESGEPVGREHLTVDYEEVWLTIPVHMIKTVQLVINFIDGGGITEKGNIDYKIEPPGVRISGDPELLDGLNTISVAQIDLAALEDSLNQTYTVYYPDGVRNLDFVDEAQAAVHIFGAETREILTMNVTPKGLVLPEGYTYSLASGPIPVTVRGPAEELEKVDANNIRVVADFSDETVTAAGRQRRTGMAYVDGFETVGALDKGYEVVIDIFPIPEDEPQ